MRSATSSAIVESFPDPDTLVPRSFTTTRALRSARSSTYARPSPRPAPVTTATLPSSEIRSVIALSPSDHAPGSSQGSPADAPGRYRGVGSVVRLGVLDHYGEAIPAGAQQLADATRGVEAVERSLGGT